MVITEDVALRSFSAELPSSKTWPGATVMRRSAGSKSSSRVTECSKGALPARRCEMTSDEPPHRRNPAGRAEPAALAGAMGRIEHRRERLLPWKPVRRTIPTAAGFFLRSLLNRGRSRQCSFVAARSEAAAQRFVLDPSFDFSRSQRRIEACCPHHELFHQLIGVAAML